MSANILVVDDDKDIAGTDGKSESQSPQISEV